VLRFDAIDLEDYYSCLFIISYFLLSGYLNFIIKIDTTQITFEDSVL